MDADLNKSLKVKSVFLYVTWAVRVAYFLRLLRGSYEIIPEKIIWEQRRTAHICAFLLLFRRCRNKVSFWNII